MNREVWIVAAKRTPIGSFQGNLASQPAPQLGSVAIAGCLADMADSQINIDEVIMGLVLSAGCGQAPARQAALAAGISESVGCSVVNKVCGSGMKAVMQAYDGVLLGRQCIVAGGMESMTNAPYLQLNARHGLRLGHSQLLDHMFLDGLEDAYDGHLMGVYAQQIADREGISRHSMDKWAVKSTERAKQAQEMGWFSDEIVPVIVSDRHGDKQIIADQHPSSINIEKIPHLKPAFSPKGSVTAANSSAISDGAAALVVMDSEMAQAAGIVPLAVIRGHATHAQAPAEFITAPEFAIRRLLEQLNWREADIDSWEINEAFAVVTLLAIKGLGLDPERVNPDGGACALGHPIGASGARILVTLLHRLRRQRHIDNRLVRGVAACCIGGGEATAIAIEIP